MPTRCRIAAKQLLETICKKICGAPIPPIEGPPKLRGNKYGLFSNGFRAEYPLPELRCIGLGLGTLRSSGWKRFACLAASHVYIWWQSKAGIDKDASQNHDCSLTDSFSQAAGPIPVVFCCAFIFNGFILDKTLIYSWLLTIFTLLLAVA